MGVESASSLQKLRQRIGWRGLAGLWFGASNEGNSNGSFLRPPEDPLILIYIEEPLMILAGADAMNSLVAFEVAIGARSMYRPKPPNVQDYAEVLQDDFNIARTNGDPVIIWVSKRELRGLARRFNRMSEAKNMRDVEIERIGEFMDALRKGYEKRLKK